MFLLVTASMFCYKQVLACTIGTNCLNISCGNGGTCETVCSTSQKSIFDTNGDCIGYLAAANYPAQPDLVCCATSSSPPPATAQCTGTCKAACSQGETPIAGPFSDCTQECCGSSGAPGGGVSPSNGAGAPGGGTAGVQPSGTGIVIPTGTGLPDPPGGIAKIIRNLLTWLLGIVGVIAIIGFVISGIQYLTSAGDEDRMQSAKRNMLYAIIGVVVVLSSFVVIQAIQYALEARSMF